MAFLKRLGYYLIGLSLGIIFLTFFLKKKSEKTGTSFCYFPNCRTLKDIRSKQISYSDAINQLIANKEIDSSSIDNFLYNGEVNFGKSKTNTAPCKIYSIEGSIKNKTAILKVKNCAERAIIESVTY